MLNLLYALVTLCAVMIAVGMFFLAVTMIKPLSFITVSQCGKIILLSLMGMILCVTFIMMAAPRS